MTKLQQLNAEWKELAKNPNENQEKMQELLHQIEVLERLCGYVLTDN